MPRPPRQTMILHTHRKTPVSGTRLRRLRTWRSRRRQRPRPRRQRSRRPRRRPRQRQPPLGSLAGADPALHHVPAAVYTEAAAGLSDDGATRRTA